MARQFLWAEILHAVGQPLAVVSSLFLGTSVVHPMEGPFVAGLINILRVLGMTFAGAFIGQFTAVRGRFHSEMLLDHAGRLLPQLPQLPDPGWAELGANLGETVAREAGVLAAADLYRVLAVLALLLIPAVLQLQRIYAPVVNRPSRTTPVSAPVSAAL
jgi:DHA2 family multidrug resistance protein